MYFRFIVYSMFGNTYCGQIWALILDKRQSKAKQRWTTTWTKRLLYISYSHLIFASAVLAPYQCLFLWFPPCPAVQWRRYQHRSECTYTMQHQHAGFHIHRISDFIRFINNKTHADFVSNDQMQRFILSQWCIFILLAFLWSSYRTWDYTNTWTMNTSRRIKYEYANIIIIIPQAIESQEDPVYTMPQPLVLD